MFFVRQEWGANANPHAHRLLWNDDYDRKMLGMELRLKSVRDEVVNCARDSARDLSDQLVRAEIEAELMDEFDRCRSEYIDYIEPFITHWNAGFLEKGEEQTYNSTWDTNIIPRAIMQEMIDECLTSGNCGSLNHFYVCVTNRMCRHIGHRGQNDKPLKTDRCATVKQKRSKDGQMTEQVKCKRRMPHPLREAAIDKDPHNRAYTQLFFPTNDRWYNGHDPFVILLNMGNSDDKASVPDFLTKPPRLNWSEVLNLMVKCILISSWNCTNVLVIQRLNILPSMPPNLSCMPRTMHNSYSLH